MQAPFAYDMLTVATPEGVAFRLPLAGPFSRMLAWMLDAAAAAAAAGIAVSLMGFWGLIGGDTAAAAGAIAGAAIHLGYNMLLEWAWGGQTLGKALLGLRVIDVHGLRLHPSQIVLRNLLRAVDALPALYALGGAALLLSPMRQRLGDMAANTVVVRRVQPPAPAVAQLRAGKYNAFRDHPHLEARLRQRLPPEGAELIAEALMRHGELEPMARVALYGAIAEWLRGLAAFPEDATLGLGDEQYIRNALDSVFRHPGAAQPEPARKPA